MIILILFAFLAGLVTILSPCILPILPIVLSSSLAGGKRRPLGVVTGFVLSFTFFTLFLSVIVNATGLSADSLRLFSVIIILFFGLSLLIPQTQIWIEQLFSKLSNLLPTRQQKDGFGGGILMGFSLGLIWTPCVGPILASVISLALTGSVSGTAFFITLAYSLGTALPMLAITYGGRQLLNRVPWLLTNTPKIQKAFGVLMILTALGIYFNLDRQFQTYILKTFPQYGVGLTSLEDNDAVLQQLDNLQGKQGSQSNLKKQIGKPMFALLNDQGEAPELIPGGQWFNTEPLTLESLRGKVVIVDFWTYSCINCIRTLPYLNAWDQKYRDKGLVILGVHTPEFEFEKNPDNVKKALADFAIQYPVMQDNDYQTWRAYNNRYWPAKYIVDKNGRIRYTHFGEGKYNETEEVIQTLLAETGAQVDQEINNPQQTNEARTPELYLGAQRMEYLISPETIQLNQPMVFTVPEEIPFNSFGFEGEWTVSQERSMPAPGSSLYLHFGAKNVFLVMNPVQQSAQVKVYVDGQKVAEGAGKDVMDGVVTIDTDRLYTLLNLPEFGSHVLRLEFLDGNVEVYAFTFG